jgi:hydroxymethylpyrimidine/phosphomethylpyrimidine kinase
MMTPIALTIAGSDPSGGAGIQADLKTFSALGVYGASVVAALTAQNTVGVRGVHVVPPQFVLAQMDAVFSDLAVGAVKIGMLGTEDGVYAVASGLQRWRQESGGQVPVVLDPVMVAGTGAPLLRRGAENALLSHLLPLSDLITPNLPEAARLLGAAQAANETMMLRQAELLLALGPKAVLIKGGHGSGDESVDIFFDGRQSLRLAAPRLHTRNTHGTGCTLSAAIAAHLALGGAMAEAVGVAKAYLTGALVAADELTIGRGAGPVHHFSGIWADRRPRLIG